MTFKEAFIEFLDAKGVKYTEVDDRAVRLMWDSKSVSSGIKVLVIFDKDNHHGVHFVCNGFCSIPEDKQNDLMVVCNALNKQYRWCKFYVDNDGDLMVEDDAILDMANVGEECIELILRMINIVDDIYPIAMKAIWA